MSNIVKNLRKEVKLLLFKNVKRMDGRAISGFEKLIQRSKQDKLIQLKKYIEESNSWKLTLGVFQSSLLPNNIVKIFVSGSATIKIRINNSKPFEKEDEFIRFTLNVPERKLSDKNYLRLQIKMTYEMDRLYVKQKYGESADFYQVVSIDNFDVISENELKKLETPKMDIPMKNASFPELDIKGAIGDYKMIESDECVYSALNYTHGFKKGLLLKTFKEYIMITKKLDDIDSVKLGYKDGVTSAMLLHLAKKRNMSMYGFDWNNKLFVKHVCDQKTANYAPFVYVLANNHCYVITDKKAIKSIYERSKDGERKGLSTGMFKDFQEDEAKTWDMPIVGDVQMSDIMNHKNKNIMFPVVNLDDVYMYLLKGHNLQMLGNHVKLSGNHIVSIYIEKNNLHLHADVNLDLAHGINWGKIKQLCESVGIKFRNQGMGAVVNEYEKQYYKLRSERIRMPKDTRDKLREVQKNKCATCDETLAAKFHVDHIKPLARGGTNDMTNLQGLCVPCHFEKTKSEQEEGYVKINPSESSFNSVVKAIFNSDLGKYWAFVENTKAKPKKTHPIKSSIDINKTRRNILLFNKHKYPVYTVMDKPEPFKRNDHIVCGFYFVRTDNKMPFRGNGWYSAPLVMYGLQNNIISRYNIAYKLLPSLSVPVDYFRDFIKSMVDKFGDFAKNGPNSFVGCFNKNDMQTSKASITTSLLEAVSELFQNKADYFCQIAKDAGVYLVSKHNNVQFDETRTPIYLYVLQQEAIELHKMSEKIHQVGGIVTAYNTDACKGYFRNDQDIKFVLDGEYWDDAKTVPKYKLEDTNEVHTPVERVARLCRMSEYTLPNVNLNVVTDQDNNDFSNLVNTVVTSNKSWGIQGPAGAGKSTLAKMIMSKLQGKTIALAPTNKAAIIINGQTIHKFIASHFNKREALQKRLRGIEYIVVDEMSMVHELFYKVFICIKRLVPKIKFILIGDFRQLRPVNDRVDCEYEHSPAYYELIDNNMVVLTKCRRSDDKIFNICKEENIGKVTTDMFTHKQTLLNICWTNEKRKKLNDICMDLYISQNKIKNIFKVHKLIWDKNSQDMRLAVGMPVISRVNNKSIGVCNNQQFIIKKINVGKCIVNDGGEDIEIETKDFNRYFHVAFALTVHKSQGSTFDTEYTIHEWDKFDNRMKYIAISRATTINNINLL